MFDINKLSKKIFESIKKYIDLSEIGEIEYKSNFYMDEYEDYLENDIEDTDSPENRIEYWKDNVDFDVTYYDNVTFHEMSSDVLSYEDIVDMFGDKIADIILDDCMKDGEGKIEPWTVLQEEEINIEDSEKLNKIAKKIFRNGIYYKDARGFILSDGTVIYTEMEHNEIVKLDGIDNKFQFIKLGNIRILPNSIDVGKIPTEEQKDVLEKMIRCYSGDVFYLDLYKNGSESGCKYVNPYYNRIISDIYKFYNDGIIPFGDN